MRMCLFLGVFLSLSSCHSTNEQKALVDFLNATWGDNRWDKIFVIPESGCTSCLKSTVEAFNDAEMGKEEYVILIANNTKKITMDLRNPDILTSQKVRILSVVQASAYSELNTGEPLLISRTNSKGYKRQVVSYHDLSDLVSFHREKE